MLKIDPKDKHTHKKASMIIYKLYVKHVCSSGIYNESWGRWEGKGNNSVPTIL
jgi:hypothetical protein